MAGYRDVPCLGEAPGGCATPLPAIEPSAAAAARGLELSAVDVGIDHLGDFAVPLGQAVLPNGVLSDAVYGLADERPSNVLVSPDGLFLEIRSLDGGPPFRNAYERGWHPRPETVEAVLRFTIEWFEPGAILQVRDIRVR
jgi:hypothetical protein